MTMFITIEVFLLKDSASSNMKSSLKKSAKHSLKLGKRLQQIEKMATSEEYGHIWDCCCDHGLLGCALLNRQVEATISDTSSNMPVNTVSNTARNKDSDIHFVDIVPELMAELENKLQRFYSSSLNTVIAKNWQTHCLDVAKLPLDQYDGKHLVIIAGIGGDLMIKFIEAINQQHKSLAIDFLLCPVHHQFSLRSKLIELDFSLIDEVLVEENQRFYEILLVSSTCSADSRVESKVSPVGDKIWLSDSTAPLTVHLSCLSIKNSNEHSRKVSLSQAEIADKYLNKTLNHYQRMQKGLQQSNKQDNQQAKTNNANVDVQHIIDAYRAVTLASLVS